MVRFNTSFGIFLVASVLCLTSPTMAATHKDGVDQSKNLRGSRNIVDGRSLLEANYEENTEIDTIGSEVGGLTPIVYVDNTVVDVLSGSPSAAPSSSPTMMPCPLMPPAQDENGNVIRYRVYDMTKDKWWYMKNNNDGDESQWKRYRLHGKEDYEDDNNRYVFELTATGTTGDEGFIYNVKRDKYVATYKVDPDDVGYESQRIVRGENDTKKWFFHLVTAVASTVEDCQYRLSAVNGNERFMELGEQLQQQQYGEGYIMDPHEQDGHKFQFKIV